MHKKQNKKKRRKNIIAVAAIVLSLILVAIGAWALEQKFDNQTQQAEEKSVLKRQVLKFGDKIYRTAHGQFETYLFLGTDYSGNPEAEAEDYTGRMADYLALFIIDRKAERYSVLQINRDTMEEITLLQKDGSKNATSEMQICTAHWYGANPQMGCENTVEAVSKHLGGLKIDGYYEIVMDDISKINEVVGGVTLDIIGDFTSVDPEMKEGAHLTLTGEQAYHYIHDRTNVGDGENLYRLQRQKQYLQAFMQQASEQGAGDPEYLLKIFEDFKEISITNITDNEMTKIARRVNQYSNHGIFEFEGESKVGQAIEDEVDHMEFYPDEDSVLEIMTELFALEEYETGGKN